MSSGNEPQKLKISSTWWIILLLFIAFNVWILWPRDPVGTDIAYSTFLDLVREGEVRSVLISGSRITGTFRQPVSPSDLTAPNSTTDDPAMQSYENFSTNFPEAVGDSTLLPLLAEQGVIVDVQPENNSWLGTALITLLPILFLVGALLWMRRQAPEGQSGLFDFGRSKARRHSGLRPQVTFADVAGADDAKEDLQEVVDFLRNPRKYHALGARIPRGILLVGPPGTGKTLMARAVSGEAGVPFFNISASEFVEMFVGVGASRVRDLFEQAKAVAPAIAFIYELDAVGRRRGAGVGTVNDEREQTLNQLLVEMDGFDERTEVIVMAATNRPDVLDPALLRPGRFDREINVGLPDRKGRREILEIHTRNLSLGPEADLDVLARSTTGFSGADLANLANEAALFAARHDHKQVTRNDFEEALDKILLGGERPLILGDEDRRTVAYHESGHAIVAWLTPYADEVHKVTIIPRGRALGVTQQLPEEDQYNYPRAYLLARIRVMLGGRGSEEVVLGDITTGAENDLVEASRLARRMITRWGMGELGLMTLESDQEQPFLGYELAQSHGFSDETAARIDRNVQNLLAEQHEIVRDLLSEHRTMLDRVAAQLLENETLDAEQLEELLGPRVGPKVRLSREDQPTPEPTPELAG